MKNYLSELRVAYLSLGCKVNTYETEAIKSQLKAYGAREVSFREAADIYIVNTCTVTNVADRKSRQMLGQAKRRNSSAIVVAIGCYVQEFHESHLEDSNIDLLIGNRRKAETAMIINQYLESIANGEAPQKVYVYDDKSLVEYEEMPMVTEEKSIRAFVKIQDGCNQFCSYCIIPFARGRISSRSVDSILTEVKALVDRGYQEIVLTGIHLSSFGLESYSLHEQSSLSVNKGELPLLSLLKMLEEVPGLMRIRLGSLEPRIMTEHFTAELSRLTKLCPHFHLSLQSGCDRTLKNMNRKYTKEQYREVCDCIRRYFEMPAITTDIIVGFPKETDEDFEESAQFAKAVAFSQIHVFPYSRRKGTVADSMTPQVNDQVKRNREHSLLEIGEDLLLAYRKEWIGREAKVLIEEKVMIDGKEYFVGHSEQYVPYALQSDENLVNRIVTVVAEQMMPDGTLLA